MPSPNSETTSNALRLRRANSSYFAHSRSLSVLTAERLSSDVPVSSANSASMFRVDSPRASTATAKAFGTSARRGSVARMRERKRWVRSSIWGTLYAIGPSGLFSRPVRSPLRSPGSGAAAARKDAATQRLRGFAVQRVLEDQPRRQAHRLRAPTP
jgi:hypothetical protein